MVCADIAECRFGHMPFPHNIPVPLCLHLTCTWLQLPDWYANEQDLLGRSTTTLGPWSLVPGPSSVATRGSNPVRMAHCQLRFIVEDEKDDPRARPHDDTKSSMKMMRARVPCAGT